MIRHLPRQETQPQATPPPTASRTAGVRLRRLAAVLTAVACGLLASATAPAAFATTRMLPDGGPP